MRLGRTAAALVIGISILSGMGRSLKHLWVNFSEERSSQDRFVDDALSRIPDSASVLLVLTNPADYSITTAFYPRPLELVRPDQTRRLGMERPDAWLVVIPHPFLAEKAYVGPARDHRD